MPVAMREPERVKQAEKQELADERRAQILGAAVACMARKGYAHTTMDDIARECGLSKGALYWYYASKRDVFMAMMREVLAQMTAEMEQLSAAPLPSATERLARALDAAAEMFEQEDIMLVTMDFWALSRYDAEFLTLLREVLAGLMKTVEDMVADGVARGEFRPVEVREVSQILLGMYDGLFFYASLGIPVEWTRVSKTLQDLLQHGLGEGGTR